MVNSEPAETSSFQHAADWLRGGGEMGDLVRRYDWSRTSLGPIQSWPQSLRTTVSLCLSSTFPMNVIWGPDSIQIYNDGYRMVCGDVHPRALGEDYRVTWASAWPAIGESFDSAWAGQRTFLENQRMFLKRLNGKLEETFFTFSHSPIQDESGQVGGLLHPVTETTPTMLAERRTRALRDLSTGLAAATSEMDVAQRTVEALAHFEFDLPFVLYYLWNAATNRYQLAAFNGIAATASVVSSSIERDQVAPWPFAQSLTSRHVVEIADLPSLLDGAACGPYEEPPQRGFVIPILVPTAEQVPAIVVTGASPRLRLNADYRSFYDLLGVTIASALAAVRAREDERRRAEALAEIDRVKTAFFSNVSHEFRTPLTLMLGPLEEMLAHAKALAPAEREQLQTVHRNSLRLLKLVNSLLDFSRIEAGRAQAVYEPTDLAAITAELASVFRSAIEKAGLGLIVDCSALSEPAYVDRDMWEKIVLNLLSNAFKFTFHGMIEVRLREAAGQVELTVRDTGIGIPPDALPKVFQRFHRVSGSHGRTHEGSGIGLALVQELAKLHGGAASVDSVFGEGSTFKVAIPLGRSHLLPEQIGAVRTRASTALGAIPFVEEALRWLPGSEPEQEHISRDIDVDTRADTDAAARARIVLADDNSDMRDYVRRLLMSRHDVEAVSDGEAALAAIVRNKPDLVLSDIMMPRLDGMQLLEKLRGDPQTRTLPIILLSARAGEESRVEGMQAGADDYLIKPFSARELLARVEAHLEMSRRRKEFTQTLRASEERFRAYVTASSDVVYRMSPDWSEMRFLDGKDFMPDTDSPSESWLARYIAPDDQARVLAAIREAIRTQSRFELEHRVIQVDGSLGWTHSRAIPIRGPGGEIVEWFGAARDVTARKRAEETQRLLVGELNHRVKNSLASVQAIVQYTLRHTKDPQEFAESFAGRIQSLARVHNLLTETTWRGADLRDLIRDQLLLGSVDETRVTASGPPVHLESQMTLHMALVLHELGTNAHKYGALSKPSGRVSIRWRVEGGSIRLRWEERGGPPASSPTRRGFGTRLIEQSLKSEGGSARMTIETGGVLWEIALPLPAKSARDQVISNEREKQQGRSSEQHQAATQAPSQLAARRFLVIEDEPLVALDISSGLEDAGAAVLASTGSVSEALDIIETKDVDAALLDGNLHGQPVDAIAAALTRRKVPFIFVTGYAREGLPEAFRHVPVLSKPFSQQQLMEAAARLLKRSGDVIQLKEN